VGVSGDAFRPTKNLSLFMLTAASLSVPPDSRPRVAAFFQLRDAVIGHRVPLLFSQPFFQAVYDLAGARLFGNFRAG
jgi:hypothetical protein